MPFDKALADRACNFFELVLKHSGEYYGEPFVLAPWQEQAICTIFGTLNDDGERLVKIGYLEVPKKTGKTELAAGLCLMFLVLDPAKGCEVYGAASVQRQALNVYRAATAMVEQSPILRKRLRILRSTHRILRRDDPNSFYAAIAADGDFSDGVNPKFVVADELHRWKTRKQMENWDVLRLGGISRKRQPLTFAITTAGVINESPLAWRLHEKVRRIEDGVVEDATFYGRIYAADPKDDWTAESTWIKANPSLKQNGGFLDLAKIRAEYEATASDPLAQAAFRRYFLNLWDQKETRAIDLTQWDACPTDWKNPGLLPRATDSPVRSYAHDFLARFIERPCFAGIDLSLTTDMSAVVLTFPRDEGGADWLPFFYMPADKIAARERRDGVPYRRWADLGYIELHEGNVIDYSEIRQRLMWAGEMFDVREYCFDRSNSREMSTALMADGKTCLEVPQNFVGLSEATKHVLGLIASGQLHHGAHPILRWNAQCLCTKSDGNDSIRPVKPDREREMNRIDGMTAGITATTRAMLYQLPKWNPAVV